MRLLALVLLTLGLAACVPHAPPPPATPGNTPGCDDPAIEALIRKTFVEDPDHAVRIAIRESHCEAGAYNPSGSSGVFQLLMPLHADLLHAVCLNGDPFNPVCNIDAAHLLWQSSGWRAWGG